MGRSRTAATASTAISSVVLAVAYMFPDEFVFRAPSGYYARSGNTVTQYITQLMIVPVWAIVFGIPGVLLIVAALFRRKLLPIAHLYTGSIWVGYAVALWITAIANPGTYIVVAVIVSLVAAFNLSLSDSYAERPAK
ncbi:putative membrane protein [Rhodococcus phage Mbo2]|uniref:Membrane protein n=1 Tax=Rhodococcus phage Mbo2 TaxID=2936911 RepID=A0A9E7IN31_9CAUD|nr:putative membrane protein [Rhodococcus phage Mbo2]